ncbi:unnamed protein product, partial [marine sediment metagenome]
SIKMTGLKIDLLYIGFGSTVGFERNDNSDMLRSG